MGVEIDFFLREVRCVERKERLVVVAARIALRQQERFRAATLLVDGAEIEPAVETVVASAGEDNPV